MKIREFEKRAERLQEAHKKAEEKTKRMKKLHKDAVCLLQEYRKEMSHLPENASEGERKRLRERILCAEVTEKSAQKKLEQAQKQLKESEKGIYDAINELSQYSFSEKKNLDAVNTIKGMKGDKNVRDFISDLMSRIELSESIRKLLENIVGKNASDVPSVKSDGFSFEAVTELTEDDCYTYTATYSPDTVEYWSERLDELSDRLYTFYSENYSEYIDAYKLEIPLRETLTYQTKEQFLECGGKTSWLGYNYAGHSYVRVGTGNELQTAVHENLHQLSGNGVMKYDGGWKNVQINEAITELLTEYTLGDDFGEDYSAYASNKECMKLIESVMGLDTILCAYFRNKPEVMEIAYDSVMGAGAWKTLASVFDRCLSADYSVNSKAVAERDRIVREYVLKGQDEMKGALSWKTLL